MVKPSAFEMMTILLTAEGLLFAALGATVSLSSESRGGRQLLTSPLTFAVVLAMITTAVAAGAAASWVELFWTGDLAKVRPVLQAWALAAGIAGPVLFCWWIALSLRSR